MTTFILVSNLYWAMEALPNAFADLELAVRRGETPTFRLTYIARRREMPSDHPWNWCKVCNVEIKVRHAHGNLVQCLSCFSRFTEVHEGTVANERIRNEQALYKAYHDHLSAIWWEWSLRCVDSSPLPDGSLAYNVTQFALPTKSVHVGERKISRRERRQLARRGHCGRRGSTRVDEKQPAFDRQTYEPEAWREMKVHLEPIGYSLPREMLGDDVVEYRRTSIGVGAHVCKRCWCEVRVIVTLYLEREAIQLTRYIERGLLNAARSLRTRAVHRESCFCKR